jgi:predicted nucleotidyltransferase
MTSLTPSAMVLKAYPTSPVFAVKLRSMEQERLLSQFCERAQKHLGAELAAVVLYGSAATGEFDEGRSDFNLLVLTRNLDVSTLRQAKPLLDWWLEKGYSWPLLMTPEEYSRAGDVFPMEITDIATAHRVLCGKFELAPIAVQRQYHRAQLEHELRSKVLRLRQKAIPLLEDGKELLRLLENSLPTFLVLLRHTLILSGHNPSFARRELLALAETHLGISISPFTELLDLRQGKTSPKSAKPVQLFESYLRETQAIVAIADRL